MKNLLVTSLTNNKKTKLKKIIIGKWCFGSYFTEKKIFNNIENNFSLNKKKKILQNSMDIEDKLFEKIYKVLNNFHNIKYNKKQWKIILGHWLRLYIRVFSNRYIHLSKILKKKKINYFYYTEDLTNGESNEIINFVEKIKDDNFNDVIYKKIIDFRGTNIDVRKKVIKSKTKKNKKFNIFNLFNLFFYKRDKIFIAEPYLKKIDNILLHLNLSIIPRFWNNSRFSNYSEINLDLRENLRKKIKIKTKNLYTFLFSNVFDYMPKAYLEDFKNISKYVKKKYPVNPKIILTANSFFFNETFKNFVAQNYKKTKYCVLQHGNNYQSHFDEHNRSIEEDTSHYFLSWFKYPKSKKYIEACMQKKIDKNGIGESLLILHWPFDQRDKIWDNFDEYTFYIKRTRLMLKKISSLKNIKSISYRVSHNHENIDGLNYLNKISKKIEFDFSKYTYNQSINNSKIAIFTYNSSGFYENLSNNIPSLMIIEKSYLLELNNSSRKYFKDLMKSDIIFTDINVLCKFLKKNWNNIDNWWTLQSTQSSVEKFVRKNAIRSNKPFRTISNKLKNII